MRDSYAQEFYQIDSQPLPKAALNHTAENDAHQDESREESNERREAIESSIDDVCGREEVDDAEDVGCSIDTEPPVEDKKETKKRVTFSEDVMMWAYSFYEAASSLEEDDEDDDSSHKYSHKHKRNIFDVVFCVSYKCACEIVD